MVTPFPREGILAALAIPTDRNGQILRSAVGAHLEWLRRQGVHGVLALGSTGEFMRFTVEERKDILITVAELAGSLPVIANISDIRPSAVAELGRFAKLLGLPGVAILPPHFYPVSAADQLAFFEYAAETSGLPVLLYNFPELAANRISIETVAAFADRAPLAGIKQSGGEFEYHRELIDLGCEKNFSVFSGADTRLPEVFAMGARGCIGGLVNFVPEDMVNLFNIYRAGAAGDPEPSRARLCEVGDWLNKLTFPLNVMAGMQARGLNPGAPKTIVSAESSALFEEIVTGLRGCFERWNMSPAGSING